MVLKRFTFDFRSSHKFENDVKTYGTETLRLSNGLTQRFENDVKTYGTETTKTVYRSRMSLRMM